MNIDLTPVVQAIICLAATLITCFLIPWIKEHTTQAQQANMRALVKTLVYAAEQIFQPADGNVKLQWVKDQLAAKGYDVDIPEIEAAVSQYLNKVTMTTIEQIVEEESQD